MESLRKLREKGGLTALVEAVNRADLGAIVPSELADPINQEALRLSTSRDDAIFERARAAERERIRLELLAEAEHLEDRAVKAENAFDEERRDRLLLQRDALRDFARRLESKP